MQKLHPPPQPKAGAGQPGHAGCEVAAAPWLWGVQVLLQCLHAEHVQHQLLPLQLPLLARAAETGHAPLCGRPLLLQIAAHLRWRPLILQQQAGRQELHGGPAAFLPASLRHHLRVAARGDVHRGHFAARGHALKADAPPLHHHALRQLLHSQLIHHFAASLRVSEDAAKRLHRAPALGRQLLHHPLHFLILDIHLQRLQALRAPRPWVQQPRAPQRLGRHASAARAQAVQHAEGGDDHLHQHFQRHHHCNGAPKL
mmetsp:Transcript_113260/g.269953  ORF Transcript_113260/g.269953 Transcript_113260/m.269953 type:complete len:256 (-) Transcript_113260:646-1413(-)